MRMDRRFLVAAAAASLVACSEPGPAPRPSASPSATPDPVAEVADLLAPRAVVRPSGGESFVNPGLVVQLGGRLHMLTNSFTRYPGASFVSHLTSEDGIEWRPDAGGPLLSNEQIPTAHETFTTSFLTAGARAADGTWMAFGYTFEGPSADGFIWRATAPDIDGPWRVDRRPALEAGPDGSWDSVRVAEPSLVETGDGHLLFYTGFDDAGVARIGVATSPDGVSWTKRAEPVFEGGAPWDGGSVGNPQVVSTPDGYVMTYRTEAGGFGFGVARSSDGLTWQPSAANPIMTEDRSPRGEPFWQSEAAVIGDEVRWWLEVGFGSASTRLFAFRLDLAAAW
jgi:predicted GH43/DUF377 family glycosyl hydrolase